MRGNILVIGDTHLPFEHKHYLDFCLEIKKRCKCTQVVHIGDLVDNHSLSFKYNADPNGLSPTAEIASAKEHLKAWYKAFPKLKLCKGNHDKRISLKARHVGLPKECLQPFRKMWNLPKGWNDAMSHVIDGVLFIHGTGYSGDLAHIKAADTNRQSTVIGHVHHICTSGYSATPKDCIFGMGVGCGINVKSYAFAYERNNRKKPIVGCGIVTDNGEYAQAFKMRL